MTEPGKLQGSRKTRVDPKPLRDYAADWGVLLCIGPAGCRKKWSKAKHDAGTVDSFGVIHWSKVDAKASARSLYRLLTFIALAKDRKMRFLPEWHRIYASSTWASWTMMRTYKRRVHISWNIGDRNRCLELAQKDGVLLRKDYVAVYMWVYNVRKRRRLLQRRRDSQDGTGNR